MKTSIKKKNEKIVAIEEEERSKAIEQKQINNDEQTDHWTDPWRDYYSSHCWCCGRHVSELKPYGVPGDPPVGDFTGPHLVRFFRSFLPFDEEAEKIIDEAYKCCDYDHDAAIRWLIYQYGEAETMRLFFIVEAYNQIETTYECRDCIILSTDEFYEKYYERLHSEDESYEKYYEMLPSQKYN
jgi:hypothetical protein